MDQDHVMATTNKSTQVKNFVEPIEIINHPIKGIMMRLSDIKIAPRPKQGEEAITGFYNPRPEDEVKNEEKIAKLQNDIMLEGIIEPPAIRVWTDPNDPNKIIRNHHIAGERRLTAMKDAVDKKLICADYDAEKPKIFVVGTKVCALSRFGTVISQDKNKVAISFDDHHGKTEQSVSYESVIPTTTADIAFEFIKVVIYRDIDDDRAMRLAFSENDNSEPLSIKAEILLIERYLAMTPKRTQKEIALILKTNETFVSQRASFRQELPSIAFEKLMNGMMAANVAINILSRPKEQREAYFAAMLAEEKMTTEQVIKRHQLEQEKYEDEAEIHISLARDAESVGDTTEATREKKKAAAAERKADTARERKERAVSEKGKINRGHASRAQTKTGITPKKGTILTRDQIEEIYVKGMLQYITDNIADPITGEIVPSEDAAKIRRIALGILEGVMDPISIIREYYVSNGVWGLPLNTQTGVNELEKSKKPKSKKEELPIDEDYDENFDDDMPEIENILGDKMWD